VNVANASPTFVKEVMAQAKQLEADWIKAAGAKGLDGAKVLAEFREELKKVAAGK
jgi:TRAP-type transport system periplasmic protein